jgi:hypothetical protein
VIARILAALLGATSVAQSAEQAVVVHFEHSGDWADFFQWEPAITQAVSSAGYEYDGNELAANGADGTIYMYGPDADKLFAVALPFLKRAPFLTHKVATLRYGAATDPQVQKKVVAIEP